MGIFGAYTAMTPAEVASVAAAVASEGDPQAKEGMLRVQMKGKGQFIACNAYLGGGRFRLFEEATTTAAADGGGIESSVGKLISVAELNVDSKKKQLGKLRRSAAAGSSGSGTGEVQSGTISGMKKPPKDEPYCFRLDLPASDSAGVSRYVLAVDSEEELAAWKASLEQAGCAGA